jgi:general secretion pathway protein C
LAILSRQQRIAAGIVLSTLGTSGVLISQGATQLIAAAALPLDASAAAPTQAGAVRPAPRERADATPILRRNIFDSATGRLDIETPIDDGTDEEEVGPQVVATVYDPAGPPPPVCDGSLRLVGAFVLVRQPEDSFAAITDATGASLLYGPGMRVENREIVAVERELVVLRQQTGGLCGLFMFRQGERVATAAPAVASAPTEPVAERPAGVSQEGLDPAQLDQGITQISEREFSIDRSLVTSLMANQAALMRTARVIPHEEGGRTVGVKLYGIRRSSLLGRLGVQNGDMLRTINGYDMTSPDSALEAYARLQSADRITINLNRRGQDMSVNYSIR